jgi:hypothetical protein
VIRQAHTYLVGAMGGATLIAIAIVVFAVLVSAQVFRDWPIAALGDGGGETAAVSSGKPAGGAVPVSGGTASKGGGESATDPAGETNGQPASTRSGVKAGSVAAGDLASTGGGQGGTETGGEPADNGGGSGTTASPQAPTGSSPSDSTGSSSSGGGGGGSAPAGGGGGGGKATSGTTPSTSGQVTETVNDTVSQVDETALGGTLGDSGVTGVTEGVVNGVAGPESAVGKVVDETVGAVGGLLHSDR